MILKPLKKTSENAGGGGGRHGYKKGLIVSGKTAA